MEHSLGLVGSVAVVSFAIGALLWAIGREPSGRRAMIFGVVLMIVGEALSRQGSALFDWLSAHRELVGAVLLGGILLVALARLAASSGARRKEAGYSKKRRVESGP